MVGNKSKGSVSWINGPTHEIRNQCLPGYTGFIPGVKAENVFSHTYSHATNASFDSKIPRGYNEQSMRYTTVTTEKFSPASFRRIQEDKDKASRRDYLEYTMKQNRDQWAHREAYLNSPRRNGQSQHECEKVDYVDHSATTMSPFRGRRDLNGSPLQNAAKDVQIKPHLLDTNLASNHDFKMLSDGFQRVFTERDSSDQDMRLPVVGYAGHRKGLKAENVFAKNFRDASIGAEKSLRGVKNTPSNFVKKP